MVSFPLRELNVQIRNLTFETSHIDIIKIKKKPGYSFIVELHLLIKEHNPVKEKSNFTIFFLRKANVFRLQEQGFTTLPVFSLRFPFSPNLITSFSARQMVHSPNILNLFEMLINLTSPKCPEVYVVINPCFCAVHRHVQ